jgi:hypothetical protein
LTTYQFQPSDWNDYGSFLQVSTYDPHTYISYGVAAVKNQWLVFQYWGTNPTMWWPYQNGSGPWSNVPDNQFQAEFAAA